MLVTSHQNSHLPQSVLLLWEQRCICENKPEKWAETSEKVLVGTNIFWLFGQSVLLRQVIASYNLHFWQVKRFPAALNSYQLFMFLKQPIWLCIHRISEARSIALKANYPGYQLKQRAWSRLAVSKLFLWAYVSACDYHSLHYKPVFQSCSKLQCFCFFPSLIWQWKFYSSRCTRGKKGFTCGFFTSTQNSR